MDTMLVDFGNGLPEAAVVEEFLLSIIG